MKKVFISFLLFFISFNLLVFDFYFKSQAEKILANSTHELTINFSDTTMNEHDSQEFIDTLIDFSKEENINISQYTYIDDQTINIYSTNLTADNRINLVSGKLPSGKGFISNKDHQLNAQVGVISFPPSNYDVRYFNFDQIKNAGVSNNFMVFSDEKDVTDKLKTDLSKFGTITLEEIYLNHFFHLNKTYLMITFFSFFVYFLVQVNYIIGNRSQIYLHKIWGYSTLSSLNSLTRDLIKPYIYLIIIYIISFIILTIIFNQLHFWIMYVLIIALLLSASLTLVTFTLWFSVRIILQSGQESVRIKGAIPFKNYKVASILIKTVVTMILLVTASISYENLKQLNTSLENYLHWNKTENVYRLNIKLPGDINRQFERSLNDSLFETYTLLDKEKNALLIYTENYTDADFVKEDIEFFYELNTVGEEEFYSPNGRSIIINKNYLDVNPISSVSDKSIHDQFIEDQNVLNILVPKKYSIYENKIKENYLEEFYFQKVEVDNFYNLEINLPPNETDINDLEINIIYVENNQNYFSFNSSTGKNNQNNIHDPIAIVLDGEFDTSAIAAFMTTSVFIIDENKSSAYDNIISILEETDTQNYVNFVVPIYQEFGDYIFYLEQRILQQNIGLLLCISLSIIFTAILIWCFYNQNAYNLYLKFLFGYSFKNRNKELFLTTFFSTYIAGLIAFLLDQSIFIVISMSFLMIIELIVLVIICLSFQRKNVGSILKGEEND